MSKAFALQFVVVLKCRSLFREAKTEIGLHLSPTILVKKHKMTNIQQAVSQVGVKLCLFPLIQNHAAEIHQSNRGEQGIRYYLSHLSQGFILLLSIRLTM